MGPNVPLFILLSIFFTACMSTETIPAIIEGPTKSPIGCHKRVYTYHVTQADAKGNTCSDKIMVNACWGRCDTKEIADWKFPFKKSHHPVCVHKGINKVVAMLQNCDPEAGMEARLYEYMEPVSCNCQICSSINTNCESPQALHKGQVVRLVGSNLENDYASMEK